MKEFKEHFLFVHIPKTAGTSFRIACEKYFGEENCIHDYSPASDKTSDIIKEIVYDEQDFFKLYTNLQEREKLLLSGHFHVNRFMSLFYTLHVITFVRNPVQQVLSHYRHHCRDLGYRHDLKTFVQDKRFKNLQSRMLAAKPLELYGFIGLTEEYEKSIEMINDYYGFNLEVLHENCDVNGEDDIDDDILKLIEKENEKDIAMYEKVKTIFEKRHKYLTNKKVWQHILMQEENENFVRGVCIEKGNQSPAELQISFQGKNIKLKAKSLRPGLLVHNLGRKGFVGFEYYGEK